ncbi:SpoIIIAH-like family protein [Caminicella sporogenes]|uniref:SpoIIIAH-like family protein n=1 Tax=Caminicella sporogenes TaxID=166485 RepID=UPI0025407E77|nr:SpoIIIAH-like family protein [Caminicella sporogenes]WIF94537.1 SpoIIIAH-like family protein [Caminicella sporogenes]
MFNLKFDKRKVVILSLVFVLISISYLNYMLNKKSILESSSDFKQYEENQLSVMTSKENEDNIVVEENIGKETATSSMMMIPEEKVVDSKQEDINKIVSVSNSNIEESLLNNEKRNKSSYFLQAKIDIEVEREKTIERFDEIINSKMTDEESRKSAIKKKMAIIDLINKEKIVESLIKSKGFEDAVVFITNESVYVTVKDEELSKSDIAKILDIVTRETKVSIDNIKIQNK